MCHIRNYPYAHLCSLKTCALSQTHFSFLFFFFRHALLQNRLLEADLLVRWCCGAVYHCTQIVAVLSKQQSSYRSLHKSLTFGASDTH